MNAQTAIAATQSADHDLKDHDIVPDAARQSVSDGVIYEKRPVLGPDG